MAVCCNHVIILKSFQIPRNLLCTVHRRGCLHAHTCTKRHNYRTNMSMHMYSQTHSFARSFPCAGCWLMMSVHVHDCLFELLIWSWYCLVFGLNIEKKDSLCILSLWKHISSVWLTFFCKTFLIAKSIVIIKISPPCQSVTPHVAAHGYLGYCWTFFFCFCSVSGQTSSALDSRPLTHSAQLHLLFSIL